MQIHRDIPAHFADFVRLNEAWISEHFSLEEPDAMLARDPGVIVRSGGHIFAAVIDGQVVGAAALFRHADGELELARMAVTPEHRRKGIGRALALAVIDKARAVGAPKITLLSNTKLSAAIALYESLGFLAVEQGDHPRYARCNIVMDKILIDAVEVLGVDHLYLSVRSLATSERFYDALLAATMGFRKSTFLLGGERHIQYYNRQLGIVIRPAAATSGPHDRGTPGLHHLCLRVNGEADVDRVGRALQLRGIATSAPRYYPEYAPDYYALFMEDPDGIRVEVTNLREERRARMDHWDD